MLMTKAQPIVKEVPERMYRRFRLHHRILLKDKPYVLKVGRAAILCLNQSLVFGWSHFPKCRAAGMSLNQNYRFFKTSLLERWSEPPSH